MQKLCKTHLNLKSPSYTKVKYTLSVFQIYWKCTSKVYLKYTSKVYLKYISSILEAYFKYTSTIIQPIELQKKKYYFKSILIWQKKYI